MVPHLQLDFTVNTLNFFYTQMYLFSKLNFSNFESFENKSNCVFDCDVCHVPKR